MSDSYKIGSVTVTPGNGGWYDVSHPSLPDGTERVQGKEKADARATEIDKGAEAPEGQMDTNPDLNGAPIQESTKAAMVANEAEGAEKVQAATGKSPKPAKEGTDDKAQLAAAQGQLTTLQARIDELEKAAGPITTVMATEPAPIPATATVPLTYRGQMDAATKKALAANGLTVSTIVLEENESIPPTGLFIGHNGRAYMIQPGEEVDVPDFLISVLDDAVMSAPIVDSSTQKVLGYRNRSKYPYRRVTAKG